MFVSSIVCEQESGTIFTTLPFLRNLRIRPISLSVTLHLTESHANNKHSSLLGQFGSYENKKGL
jgi:hypothetical protein